MWEELDFATKLCGEDTLVANTRSSRQRLNDVAKLCRGK